MKTHYEKTSYIKTSGPVHRRVSVAYCGRDSDSCLVLDKDGLKYARISSHCKTCQRIYERGIR